MSDEPTTAVLVDCDRGRAMGCQSFCCALLIRLGPGERDPSCPPDARKSCIDKDVKTGRCVHQEPITGRCRIWAERPAVCRRYDCNNDPNLQVVLRDGFRSLMGLLGADREASHARRRVPYVNEDLDSG